MLVNVWKALPSEAARQSAPSAQSSCSHDYNLEYKLKQSV